MCDPVLGAIALGATDAGLQIGQQVTSFIGQGEQFRTNRRNAIIQRQNDTAALEAREGETVAAAQAAELDRTIAELKSRGRIAVSAAESGLGSATVDAQLRTVSLKTGTDATRADINLRNQQLQFERERQGLEDRQTLQIASVQRPSPLALVLGIGQALLSGASTAAGAGAFDGGSKPEGNGNNSSLSTPPSPSQFIGTTGGAL